MEINFLTTSWLVATLVLMAITTIPVKIGAELFDAPNKDIKYCALAVVLGTISAVILFKLLGGFLGLVASFIAISVIYYLILQISFAWSFTFTLMVIILQSASVKLLKDIGIFT